MENSLIITSISIISTIIAISARRNELRKCKRNIWYKLWHIIREQIEDRIAYQNFLKLNEKLFQNLFKVIEPLIKRQDTNRHECISTISTIGVLDGRHIKFRLPRSAGSLHYNYKGDHSIVLLALADAHYYFTYINISVNDRISNGEVFGESNLSKATFNNILDFPNLHELPHRKTKVPFVIVADDAFLLSTKIFNYCLSRARRVIKNSFEILANRFTVLLNSI
ncbi:hypothetical protein ACFW04_011802 [Cataglyphis niger]